MRPETKYAKSGDVHIAYQVFGEGDVDVVVVPGFVSHVELMWEYPPAAYFGEGLARLGRVITFDRRGSGLSDPVHEVPTLDTRMDDVRAVMDAADSERAVLLGFSEGAPMCILFAATYPDRVRSLVLYGALARSTEAADYDLAPPAEAFVQANAELIAPHWGEGVSAEVAVPSVADDPSVRAFWARAERQSASPAMAGALYRMFLDIDVRDVLPSVRVPTLVLHRHGDRLVNVRAGRYVAEHIPGARFVELPGSDHNMWFQDPDRLLDLIEEFVTGSPPSAPVDRVLMTILFTDIVGSTERAAEVGDLRWRQILEEHQAVVRRSLERFSGREVNTTGDGFVAVFQGPARAIACAKDITDASSAMGLEVRTGVHTGECEVMGDDVAGLAVHIAARVAGLADAGEVLVSRTVKDLVVGSAIEFADRGEQELKGVPGTWHLYAAH